MCGKPASVGLTYKPEWEIRVKRSVVFAGLLAAVCTTGLFDSPQARARTPFDGAWSVLVVTDQGACDRAYRYALQIADGRVFYDNSSISVSGQVDGAGRVRVALNGGGQSASGYGRLSGNYGEGSWSGRSSVSQCSGHWQAERRG